ncbi:MAG: hypothetical protein OQK04_14445 [Kangiellaceae bacterium]|nr:hypothetical protein [Kangiellaceae bacterium]
MKTGASITVENQKELNEYLSYSGIFGSFISEYLSDLVEMPDSFRALIKSAVLPLVDSTMIIEDNLSAPQELQTPQVKQPLESFEQIYFIDELIDSIKNEGLAGKFHELIGLFGSINMSLSATEQQKELVEQWVEQGHLGHFLMTDVGGPTLSNWQSILTRHSDEHKRDVELSLKVNKIHGIEAHKLGFAMVVAREKGKPFPVTLLLPPEITKAFQTQTIGKPFLDGSLQLGNVKGEVTVNPDVILTKGGLAGVNRFLTLVRPRFVKSLMHFIIWLNDNRRVDLSETQKKHIDYLIDVCNCILQETEFSIHSVDRVLALKFSSNELLLDLVRRGSVKSIESQRDLLAFTKMEGSSYRCFFEIYSKKKRGRI